MLIKTGEMTPFGGTVDNVTGKKELHGVVTGFSSHSCTNQQYQRDQRDPGLDCGANQDNKAHQAHEKSLARPIAENHQSENDNNDDEYVPDEGELKYSWYEGESDEGTGREPAKSEKQTAKKRSLNVAYREEDSLKSKKKKRTRKMGRRLDTGPVDDGNEKIYRNRIR